MADSKTWTGERLETFIQNENTNEHLHRYALALDFIKGKKVLDIACGEGYGSNLLSGSASDVTGVDIDAETVAVAKAKYQKKNLKFLTGSADSIPCADCIFDLAISFETIEHHDRHEEMMAEIRRVLKPGGIFIISSPDKLYYTDKTGYKNPYHVKELYAAEFETLLERYFKHTIFLRQKSFVGSLMIPQVNRPGKDESIVYKGSYTEIIPAELEAVYIIGIASDAELPDFKTTFFDGNEVLKQQFRAFQDLVTETVKADVKREIESSRTYRLGYALSLPFKFFKKLLHAS